MRYKFILFDFDGTLADTFPFFTQVFNQLAEEFQFKRIESDEWDSLRGFDAAKMIKYVGLSPWKMPMVATRFKKLMMEKRDSISLFPGVPEMLKRLTDAGLMQAVVSSNSRENIEKILGPENVPQFRFIEGNAGLFTKQLKLRKALRIANVVKEEAIYIGDEGRDADASRKLGLAFGAAAYGYTSAEALEKQNPVLLFKRPEEIAEQLLAETFGEK